MSVKSWDERLEKVNALDIPNPHDEIARLRAENARLRAALARRGLKAPCEICGYNGPGFHQPQQHACAALENARKG